MGLQTVITIRQVLGDRTNVIQYDRLDPSYAKYTQYETKISKGSSSVQLPLGDVKTAAFVYVETDVPVTLARNHSMQRESVSSLFFLVGTAITSLDVIASSEEANLKVFIAGG